MAQPTIKRGSTGEPVKTWQRIIVVNADGNFGPATEAATKTWQGVRGLKADGVVGPKTWAAAEPAIAAVQYGPPTAAESAAAQIKTSVIRTAQAKAAAKPTVNVTVVAKPPAASTPPVAVPASFASKIVPQVKASATAVKTATAAVATKAKAVSDKTPLWVRIGAAAAAGIAAIAGYKAVTNKP